MSTKYSETFKTAKKKGINYLNRLPGSDYFTTADQALIFFSTLIILFVVVVVPILVMFYYSLAPQFPVGTEGYTHITTEHYVELVENQDLFLSLTLESIYFAGGSTLLALALGLSIAIIEIKYLPTSKWRYLVLIPYAIPSVAAVTGWVVFLGQGSPLNLFLMDVFGLSEAPIDIYTRAGMIFIEALHITPIAFLLLSPSIRAIPKAVDEAALTAGASMLTVYRRIIVPLIFPAIFSIAIFLFARLLAAVVIPSTLGLDKQIFTWGSAIPFLFLYGAELNYSISLAFSIVITAVSGLLMVAYYYSVKQSEKYTTVTGAGSSEPRVYDVGPVKRLLASSFIGTYIFIAAILPVAVIFWDSVSTQFMLASALDPSTYTLARYTALLEGSAPGIGDAFFRALRNSVLLGIVIPTIAVAIAYLISYSNQSLDIPLSGFTSWLASVPLTIPSIAISLAFLVTFIQTPLYGTFVLIVIAMLTRAIPTGMRYTDPGLIRLGKENVEMAKICGQRELRTLKNIVLPLSKGDFIAGWMHLYVSSVREVTIPLLLYAVGAEVLGVELLFALVNGDFKTASTVGVVLIAISTLPYMLLQYYRARHLGKKPGAAKR